jgi:hypothetical protein
MQVDVFDLRSHGRRKRDAHAPGRPVIGGLVNEYERAA